MWCVCVEMCVCGGVGGCEGVCGRGGASIRTERHLHCQSDHASCNPSPRGGRPSRGLHRAPLLSIGGSQSAGCTRLCAGRGTWSAPRCLQVAISSLPVYPARSLSGARSGARVGGECTLLTGGCRVRPGAARRSAGAASPRRLHSTSQLRRVSQRRWMGGRWWWLRGGVVGWVGGGWEVGGS